MTHADTLTRATASLGADNTPLAPLTDARAHRAELRREHKTLSRALPSLNEIEQTLRRSAGETAQSGLAEYGPAILSRLANPARRRYEPVLPNGLSPWMLACMADVDAAVETVMAVVRKVAPEAGVPSAERVARLAAIDVEIAELDAAEEAFIDRAQAAGITIAHSPETIRRRENEARLRALDEAKTADALARHKAIDDTYERRSILVNMDAPSRVGQSGYLANGKLNAGDPR